MMKQIKCVLLIVCITVLIAFVAESEAGPGCAWSGCGEFKSIADVTNGVCNSGVTGGSGRPTRYKGQICGFMGWGGMDFCCDSNCKYEACGDICSDLQKTSWSHEIPSRECMLDMPGYKKVPSRQEFCCP